MKDYCLSSYPKIIERNDPVPMLRISLKTTKRVEPDKIIYQFLVGYMPSPF